MESKLVKYFVLSTGVSVAVPVVGVEPVVKPNILILFADDLGWNDISSPVGTDNRGSNNHQTPNIDRLFNEGRVFTRAYTQQNSAPTRAALLTGQYATRTGVFNVGSLDRGSGDANATLIVPPVQNNNILSSTLTFAEVLRTVGYKNYIFGKVHGWGGDLNADHGFDYDFSTGKKVIRDGEDLSNYLAYNYKGKWIFNEPAYDSYAMPYTQEYINKNLKPFANGNNPDVMLDKPKHFTDAIADCVIDQIAAANKDHPFCMWVSFHAIHSAIVSREDLYDKYSSRTALDSRHTNYKYAALTEQLDQTVGRILAALEDPDGDGDKSDSMVENTLVIFTSDNGGVGGTHYNTPLRGEKGMFHEGGIRVPMAVRYPGKISAGTVTQERVHVTDFLPTLADVAGAALPDSSEQILDGESFAPVMFGVADTLKRSFIRWHFPGYLDTRLSPTTTVNGRVEGKIYKLHYYYEQQRYELYCITDDEVESNNLLSEPTPEQLSIAGILRDEMVRWLTETNTYQMYYRADNRPVELPVNEMIVLPSFRETFNRTTPASGNITAEELNEQYADNQGWEGDDLSIVPAQKAGEFSRLSAAIGTRASSRLISPEINYTEPFQLQFRGRMIKSGVDNNNRNFMVIAGNDTIYNHKLGLNNTYTTHAIRQFNWQSDQPYRLNFAAVSSNAGAEGDGITVGEIEMNPSAGPTINVGVGHNWDAGSIAPEEEKEFSFSLKGWNLTSGLTAQLNGEGSNIQLLKTGFTPENGIVDDVLSVRVVAPQNQGLMTALITITGGGIVNPAYRKLWLHYDVNPFQDIPRVTGKKISVHSFGKEVRITSDSPAEIMILSPEGRIIAQASNAGLLSKMLEPGIYLLSVDGKTSKYIHMIKC
jgi:arylsulfatase A-like enzyme